MFKPHNGCTIVHNETAMYPCPCCGFLTLGERGVFEICPVCDWEDDFAQACDSTLEGGANRVSLEQARRKFILFEASCAESIRAVRKPLAEEVPSGSGPPDVGAV